MLGWELPPHNSGGLGVACYHMGKALAGKGADIDFVVPYQAEHPGVDFMNVMHASPLSPLERYGLGAYDGKQVTKTLAEADARELKDMRGVQKRYVQYVETLLESPHAYEAIHAHDWLTMEAGMRAKEVSGVPLIVHVHATEYDRAGSVTGNPLVHEIEYMGLMMADKVIAVSNVTKSIIVHKYGIPADKIEVVHNAIDPTSFADGYDYDTQTYKYLETLKSEGYTIVGTVTRFTVQKGLTHLMKAASAALSMHDRLVFLFAGDGEQRDELVQLAADYGISDKVFFTGFVRGKKWRDVYSVADVFVMSSVSEPFGLTALEAAHHDSALIITRQSGVGEILHSIYRYDFWDTDALADKLVACATSPALLASLRENVKKEYANLSWHDVADKFMEIYRTHRSFSPNISEAVT